MWCKNHNARWVFLRQIFINLFFRFVRKGWVTFHPQNERLNKYIDIDERSVCMGFPNMRWRRVVVNIIRFRRECFVVLIKRRTFCVLRITRAQNYNIHFHLAMTIFNF
jgi:hypothetical protein